MDDMSSHKLKLQKGSIEIKFGGRNMDRILIKGNGKENRSMIRHGGVRDHKEIGKGKVKSLKVKKIALREHNPINNFKNTRKFSLKIRLGKPMCFQNLRRREDSIGIKQTKLIF